MDKYLKLFLVISLFLVAMAVEVSSAPMIAPSAPITEAYYYTYSVKDDGSANVWLRIDELQATPNERTYSLELPKGAIEGVKAWYRENSAGCIYPMEGDSGGESPVMETEPGIRYEKTYPCVEQETSEWKELKTAQQGNKLYLTIPKLKTVNNQNSRTLSLGLSFKIASVTSKKWWGREIKVETAKSENYISYESVGVELPPGVYVRDRQTGPVNWGEMMGERAMMSQSVSDLNSGRFAPTMFDQVGSGQIVKDKSNILPGENFSFTLMSATSIWKLYVKEIGIMLGGVLVLILVAGLLLHLIIGRKPIWWYLAVMFLIAIFVVIIIWFVTMYRSLFYGYPAPYNEF